MYKPIFRITPHLLKLIDEASALREWINNSTLKVRWLPSLQFDARARAANSSTSIEGNPLTLIQVEKLARKEYVGAPEAEIKEVLNYLKALKRIEKKARSAISEKALLALHKTLTEGLLPKEVSGRYKEKQNYVVNKNRIRIYTPPSPEETPKLTRELLSWLNLKETGELHGVVVCAILHHRLVSIHPFSDGNGRIARLLGMWVLYQRDYDAHHIFSLDDHFAADRDFYYKKIEQARELDDDLTYWIEYVSQGIVETLKNVKKRIKALHISSGSDMALSPRQEELLSILQEHGRLPVAEITKEMKITRARANQLLRPLIDDGMVIMKGKGRATTYRLK
jgi:Fic family protein